MSISRTDRKRRFTKIEIQKLACPPEKHYILYQDMETKGLSIRVTPSGRKTFVYRRKFQGWRNAHEENLGLFPELTIEQARNQVAALNARFASGEMPGEISTAEKKALTYGDLFRKYLENYAKVQLKTWEEAFKNHERYFKEFDKRKLETIRRSEVQTWLNKLGRDSGKHTANRNYDTMRAVFSWGKRNDLVAIENPCTGVDKFKTEARERFINPGDEYQRFVRALEQEPNETMRDYFWMSLYTGQRAGNVMAMRWDEVNFELQTWRIPMTKNGQSHTVPLTDDALRLLKRRAKTANGAKWVFQSDRVSRKTGEFSHIVEPKDAWKRLLERAEIEDLRIHDLRRTMGSYMAINGASSTIIGKALGHRSTQATAIYARLSQDPVRVAMQNAQNALSMTTVKQRKQKPGI